MIKKIIRQIKTFSFIVRLVSKESNNFSLGSKVRKTIDLYKKGSPIPEEEIIKENPKI
jgi:hypothetical protein